MDIELSAIDSDKTIGFVVKNEDKLKDGSFAFV